MITKRVETEAKKQAEAYFKKRKRLDWITRGMLEALDELQDKLSWIEVEKELSPIKGEVEEAYNALTKLDETVQKGRKMVGLKEVIF